MKSFFRKYKAQIVFTLIGGLSGLLYWKFIGCKSGTCAIKSVWYYTTLYGMFFGYLISDIILGYIEKRERKTEEKH